MRDYRIVYDGWHEWRCRVVTRRSRYVVEVDRQFGSFGWERFTTLSNWHGLGWRTWDKAAGIAAKRMDRIERRFKGEFV